MDATEIAILEYLVKNHLTSVKDLTSSLLERHFDAQDIEEALATLQRSGWVSLIDVLGNRNIALTKTGIRAAADKRMF